MQRALLLVFAFLALVNGQCNPSRSVDLGSFCACYSGSYGPECNSRADWCIAPTPELLQTTPIAELMVTESTIGGNYFTFIIHAPQSFGRYFQDISLGGCGLDQTHFSVLSTTSPGCMDVYQGNFSIPELVNTCGIPPVNNPTDMTLTAELTLTAITPLGFFRSTQVDRTTVASKTIALHFPTAVTVTSSNITIAAPMDLMAAIVRQEYDGVGTFTIELLTSVQYPYKLFTPALTQSQAGLTPSAPSLVDSACDELSGDCVQSSTFTVTGFGGSLCSLGANFTLDFNYNCRSGVDCPYDGTDIASVDFYLESDEVCATLEFQSSIGGFLDAFSDAGRTTSSLAFLDGETIFLRATVNADVAIATVAITGDVRLVDSSRGTNFVTVLSSPQPGNVIDFDITPLLGVDLPAGDLVVFTVEADITVTYSTSFKRDVLSKTIPFSKQIVMTTAH